MLLSGDRDAQTRQLAEILDGYEEFREFDPRELHLVEPLRTLRMLHFSAWIGRRWDDPAFPKAFPWFNSPRYWGEEILNLRTQLAELNEPVLRLQRDQGYSLNTSVLPSCLISNTLYGSLRLPISMPGEPTGMPGTVRPWRPVSRRAGAVYHALAHGLQPRNHQHGRYGSCPCRAGCQPAP